MLEEKIFKYIRELKNKIELKMIPNKTEEQILYNQFKFYDLELSGKCTLQNFIKSNDRIGVVLPDLNDYEIIFNYYADQDSGLLDYKKFIKIIFGKKKEEKVPEEKDDFVNVLVEKIIQKGRLLQLLNLLKYLQINDYEENSRMSIQEFFKVLQKCKINLKPEEADYLYCGGEYCENGLVKYKLLINIMLEQFWSDKKLSMTKEIYHLFTCNGKKEINLNILKQFFDDNLKDTQDKQMINKFIDEYKIINKIDPNKSLSSNDLVKLFKYYNFGQNSSGNLNDIINILRDSDSYDKKVINLDYSKKGKSDKKNKCVNFTNGKIQDICNKLVDKFVKFGRKSLFNFIVHFKFYDNYTGCISKYDFSKVLKDYNIKLSLDEIDTIFKLYGADKVGTSIYYQNFLNELVLNYNFKNRIKIINNIYDSIKERAKNFGREIDITFLKEIYYSKNNYFKRDESDNKLEFDDCLDLFHFNYKGYKTEEISKKEFNEFYLFISLLIPSDNDFIYMISNEWRSPIKKEKINLDDLMLDNEKNKNLTNMSNRAQIGETITDYQSNITSYDQGIAYKKALNRKANDKEEVLNLLTNTLIKRGLRGILYLYNQFLCSCKDINKISFSDFSRVFKIQHINFNDNILKQIFNIFNSNGYLDFYSFIRTYKKELSDNKLKIVEKAYSSIDINGEDKVPLNDIKIKYNAKNHPDVLKGKYTEDEKIMEFLDCFSLCYNILKADSKIQEEEEYVDFEIFANFYEYVSFIYPKDKDFQDVVTSTWN